MTTPRTRRNKPQQALDILLALLKDQDAKAEKLHLLWEDAIEEADRTRRALELLETGTVKDFQPPLLGECVCGYNPENGYRLDVPCPFHSRAAFPVPGFKPPEELARIGMPVQRIGAKAQGVNDVWKAGDGTVSVHSALMYARQDLCQWCKAGVPFSTEARTEHYIVTKRVDGVVRGFEYKPCTGIKEWDMATKDFGKGDA